MSSAAAASAPSATSTAKPRRSIAQELGLVVVVLLLGSILAIYGWRDAGEGRPNTFLNFDNLIDGIATPMSYYAIMAVGVTIVIITGGNRHLGGLDDGAFCSWRRSRLAEFAARFLGNGSASDCPSGAVGDRSALRVDQWRG